MVVRIGLPQYGPPILFQVAFDMIELRPAIAALLLFATTGHAEFHEASMPADDSHVVVVLEAEVSQAARGNPASLQAKAFADAIDDRVSQLGSTLRPQHPGTTDPDLSGYFLFDVPADVDVGGLIETLTALEGVEGAYIKPQPAPP